MDADARAFDSLAMVVLEVSTNVVTLINKQDQALKNQKTIAEDLGLIKHLVANMSIQAGPAESFQSLQTQAGQTQSMAKIYDKLNEIERDLRRLR